MIYISKKVKILNTRKQILVENVVNRFTDIPLATCSQGRPAKGYGNVYQKVSIMDENVRKNFYILEIEKAEGVGFYIYEASEVKVRSRNLGTVCGIVDDLFEPFEASGKFKTMVRLNHLEAFQFEQRVLGKKTFSFCWNRVFVDIDGIPYLRKEVKFGKRFKQITEWFNAV